MLTKTEATIYLAGIRACSQAHWYRNYRTFKDNSSSFGTLRTVNDDTLKAGHSYNYGFKEQVEVMLLPVVGGLNYRLNQDEQHFIEVGTCCFLSMHPEQTLTLTNPYSEELINYICIVNGEVENTNAAASEFDLDTNRNKLLPLNTMQSVSIGKFGGREEGSYKLTDPCNGLFVLVIEGAFEVQNRLLQPRDGLSLWNVDEVEFEALSNDAVILFLETELRSASHLVTA